MKAVKIRVKNINNPKPEMEYLESLGYKWTATASKPDFAYYLVGEQEGNFLYSADGSDYDDYKDSHIEVFLEDEFQEIPQPIKSDGGSSNYYKLTITNKAGESIQCELGDVIRVVVGNDADLFNIIKACRRAYESSQGRGKDGVSIQYDMNKIIYFANEFAHWHKQC